MFYELSVFNSAGNIPSPVWALEFSLCSSFLSGILSYKFWPLWPPSSISSTDGDFQLPALCTATRSPSLGSKLPQLSGSSHLFISLWLLSFVAWYLINWKSLCHLFCHFLAVSDRSINLVPVISILGRNGSSIIQI